MSLQKRFFIIFGSILVLILLSLLLFLKAKENEEKIADAQVKKYQSYLLADELRQSSDDLTRMARTYTVTGQPQYKEYFKRILAIRNGKIPRPANYHSIYWDFVMATGMPPRTGTIDPALRDLMEEAEFTEAELALLRQTENEANRLAALELRAINDLEGLHDDGTGTITHGEPEVQLARSLLYGDEYHRAKEKIMKPLEKFFHAFDHGPSGEIALYRDKQRRLYLVIMLTLGLSALLAFVSLGLGLLSLKQNKTDSGRSKLAERLAASGYPSPVPGAGKQEDKV